VEEEFSLAHPLENADEPPAAVDGWDCGVGRTLGQAAGAHAWELHVDDRRGRPVASAERWRRGSGRTCTRRDAGGKQDGSVRAERPTGGGGEKLGLGLEGTVPNRYDRRDPRFRVAPDEPTAEKR
jgi:hypothetical protein